MGAHRVCEGGREGEWVGGGEGGMERGREGGREREREGEREGGREGDRNSHPVGGSARNGLELSLLAPQGERVLEHSLFRL